MSRYTDYDPSSLARPNSDLVDYYDDGHIPAPHHFASSYPVSPSASAEHLHTPQPDHPSSYVAVPSSTLRPELMDTGPYSNLGTSSSWKEKELASGRRSKWIVAGSIAALVALVVVGVAVGVTVSKSHKNSNNASSSGTTTNGPSGVVQSDPNDPSNFVKDLRLNQSFYGLAYTPENAITPNCNVTLGAVIEDIQLMSQLTTRIRLYGADCNQTSVVLDAIQRTKVNITVYVGNYVLPSDSTGYKRQRDELEAAFKQFGTDHVAGVTVGNEYMLNYLTANGGTSQDINGPTANAAAQQLVGMINDTRTWLQGLSLSTSILVGNADAGSFFNNQVLASIDYGMANVHAWFASVRSDQASGWVDDFFNNTDVAEAQAVPNKPQMFIAETGWPTNANDTAHASNGPGTASEKDLQTFLDTFVCAANKNGTGYFFFEAFDEPWKEAQFGGVEGFWGLFTANKTLKNINIPRC